MTAAALAERLHARRCGRGWIARCPAHNDRTPSLSIAEGRDRRVLVRCHGGCSTADILRCVGLGWPDLFAGPHEARPTDALDARTRWVVAAALDGARRHPALRGAPEIGIILADETRADEAIAHALARAVGGEVVQIGLLGEVEHAS